MFGITVDQRSASRIDNGLFPFPVQITETGVERKMIAGDKLPLWFEEIPVEPGFKPFGKPTQEAAAA
jgi:hypothetical protein